MLRSVSFLVVLVALLAYSAQAIPVRISADVLRVGTYDSDIDGFGTIVDDFDLGTVHAGLSGVLLDVTTVNDSGNAEVKVDAGARWNINRDKGSIVYSFSSAVAFHFSTGGGGDGPFTGNNVIFGDGELLTFMGDPGSFSFFSPGPVDPNLLVGGNYVQNASTTSSVDGQISQGLAYGSATRLTTLTMNP